MGGTSVAFNVSATLLLCLIRGGFLQFFHGTLVAYICFCWVVPFVYADGIS